MDRRQLLAATGLSLAQLAVGSESNAGVSGIGDSLNRAIKKGFAFDFPPVRTITKGPRFHWFGYYDKLQFDPMNRYVLSNQVAFEHRTPHGDDEIK